MAEGVNKMVDLKPWCRAGTGVWWSHCAVVVILLKGNDWFLRGGSGVPIG